VERRIIGVKRASPTPAAPPAVRSGAREASAPAVRHLAVDPESAGQRLDNFLLRELKGVPKSHVYRVIRSGEVRINGGRAAADTRLSAGDELRLPPVRVAQRTEVAPAPAREFPILFEDDHLLAIDKPAGVAVHGGSGVSFGVIEQLRRARPAARFLELVHRLDRETSGVLLVACRRSALTRLQDQFRAHGADKTVGKTYAALVAGSWPERLKVIDTPLHKFLTPEGERRVRETTADDPQGAYALTLIRVVRRWPGMTLLDVTIRTGRTHQIRVHLAGAGCPIVGDDKYGDFALNRRVARGEGLAARMERMFLHARLLRVTHPATGDALVMESPLPTDCAAFLKALDNGLMMNTAPAYGPAFRAVS
jgi:23S rRNA pseudouridine955/2504/2580 synthase